MQGMEKKMRRLRLKSYVDEFSRLHNEAGR